MWPRDLCYVRYWRRNDDGSYGNISDTFLLRGAFSVSRNTRWSRVMSSGLICIFISIDFFPSCVQLFYFVLENMKIVAHNLDMFGHTSRVSSSVAARTICGEHKIFN